MEHDLASELQVLDTQQSDLDSNTAKPCVQTAWGSVPASAFLIQKPIARKPIIAAKFGFPAGAIKVVPFAKRGWNTEKNSRDDRSMTFEATQSLQKPGGEELRSNQLSDGGKEVVKTSSMGAQTLTSESSPHLNIQGNPATPEPPLCPAVGGFPAGALKISPPYKANLPPTNHCSGLDQVASAVPNETPSWNSESMPALTKSGTPTLQGETAISFPASAVKISSPVRKLSSLNTLEFTGKSTGSSSSDCKVQSHSRTASRLPDLQNSSMESKPASSGNKLDDRQTMEIGVSENYPCSAQNVVRRKDASSEATLDSISEVRSQDASKENQADAESPNSFPVGAFKVSPVPQRMSDDDRPEITSVHSEQVESDFLFVMDVESLLLDRTTKHKGRKRSKSQQDSETSTGSPPVQSGLEVESEEEVRRKPERKSRRKRPRKEAKWSRKPRRGKTDVETRGGMQEGDKKAPKPRPNAFVSIRIPSTAIREKLRQVQQVMLVREKKVKSALVSVEKLHLTLMVLRLENEEMEEKAKLALLEATQRAARELSGPLRLEFRGVGRFGSRVVFACIREGPDKEKLAVLAEIVKSTFEKHGLPSTDTRPFNPHLTIAKVSPHSRGVEHLEEGMYSEHVDTMFGTEVILGLELLSMTKPATEDGYYFCFQKSFF